MQNVHFVPTEEYTPVTPDSELKPAKKSNNMMLILFGIIFLVAQGVFVYMLTTGFMSNKPETIVEQIAPTVMIEETITPELTDEQQATMEAEAETVPNSFEPPLTP